MLTKIIEVVVMAQRHRCLGLSVTKEGRIALSMAQHLEKLISLVPKPKKKVIVTVSQNGKNRNVPGRWEKMSISAIFLGTMNHSMITFQFLYITNTAVTERVGLEDWDCWRIWRKKSKMWKKWKTEVTHLGFHWSKKLKEHWSLHPDTISYCVSSLCP